MPQAESKKFHLRNLRDKKVYHGSYTVIKKPDLSYSKEGKDFGKGFYITTDRNQAIKFAKQMAYRYGTPCGVLNIYDFSNFDGLDIWEFENTDITWLDCILGFRRKRFRKLANPYRDYEVLMGKIADDDTSSVLNAYIAGSYGKVGSQKAKEITIGFLEPENLKNQICFKTENSLKRIKFVREEYIWL